jgi:hypothetical protein
MGGLFANRDAPPYPKRVLAPDESVLFTKEDILAGRDVFQRYGLMDHGSVWGHGSQRGMEFSESKDYSAMPGSGSDTRAGNILNWAGYGRHCFLWDFWLGSLSSIGPFTAEQRNSRMRIFENWLTFT